MKKIILSALALIALTTVSAQISTDAGTFTKPIKGTTIFEANLTPDLSGGGIFTLSDVNSNLGTVGVRIRQFHSEKKACRWGAHLSMLDSGVSGVDTEFAIGVLVGVEHHRAGAERLSTYWGYEANAGYVTSNDDYEGQNKKFGLGASVFTGADYYIIPKVYLGAELGWGAALTNTNPDWGDNVTRLELGHSISPVFRVGWQF